MKTEKRNARKGSVLVVDDEEIMREVHDRLVLQGALLAGEPDKGVVEVLCGLAKSHEIFYITARGLYDSTNLDGIQMVQDHTKKALARWGLPNPHDVAFCEAHEKGSVCVERMADVIIEDSEDNLRWIHKYAQAHDHRICMVLRVRPSNRNHALAELGVVELECFTHLPRHLDLLGALHLEQTGRI